MCGPNGAGSWAGGSLEGDQLLLGGVKVRVRVRRKLAARKSTREALRQAGASSSQGLSLRAIEELL